MKMVQRVGDETLDSRKPRSSIFSSKEDERLGEEQRTKGSKSQCTVYSESLELASAELNFYGFWLKVNLILYQKLDSTAPHTVTKRSIYVHKLEFSEKSVNY